MEENTYCVYMHTLLSDKRRYIGITRQDPKIRWGKNGNGYSKQPYFYNAIQKYDWDSFKHDILFENLTKEQACAKECALIKLFNTQDKKFGFNLTSGGDGTHNLSEESKQKINVGRKANISRKDLYHQYIELNKTQQECSDYFTCDSDTVGKYLHEYGIKKEFRWVGSKISYKDLEHQYMVLNKTLKECADYFGCSWRKVQTWVKKYNLNKHRDKGRLMYKTLERSNLNYKDVYYQYIELGKTRQECIDYFKCSLNTFKIFCHNNNIYKKHMIRKG